MRGMAARFQFSLRNLFWATTVVAIALLLLQFAFVGIPYWVQSYRIWGIHAKQAELARLRELQPTLHGEEKQEVSFKIRELDHEITCDWDRVYSE
jgi:hypothetical protein